MLIRNIICVVCAVATALVVSAQPASADSAAEQRSLEELRNTVVNLLQALVEKGLMTREQAQLLVKQAQDKAAADAAARAAQNAAAAKDDANAVRVTQVPQIVKDEISKQVAQEVQPAVVADVVRQAKLEKWGVPAALPEWLSAVQPFGDVTIRAQADMLPSDNAFNQILNFQAINTAGGQGKLANPFLNTTEDSDRLRLRARLGLLATLDPHWSAAIRLSSGSLTDPGSESQTLGNYGARYTIGLDEAYIRWASNPVGQLSWMSSQAGRFLNPWLSPSELIYARDLTFEGVSSTWRLPLPFGVQDGAEPTHVFFTAGAFPLLDQPTYPSQNKWMVGGQLGVNAPWAQNTQHLRMAAAFYDFLDIEGRRNAPDSTLLNYTAPAFLRNGNSVFDISNSTTDSTVNLYALASKFRLINLSANYQWDVGRHQLFVDADAVRNVGYRKSVVDALTGQVAPRAENIGFVGDVGFGDPAVAQLWDWRARIGYRYVRSDAVIDAWTDADFHEGGTNVAGFFIWGELGLGHNVWTRVRYLSGNEIDGPRYGLDIVQLDLSTRF
ncbi:MAG TPA: putative porin [Steroidobacteraceae bacterium]